MAGFRRTDWFQSWTHRRTIDTAAPVVGICIVASIDTRVLGLHALGVIISRLFQEIDLKRTSKQLLVAQELQELGIILSTAANERHRFATARTILDFFATVVEPALVVFRPSVIELRDNFFPVRGFAGICDIDEQGLVGRASESAEDVEEVLLASWT
jgi:hypothetical protein